MRTQARPLPWYRRPAWLGLVGLALMVSGWKLSTFVPRTARQEAQQERLDELRRLARDDEGLSRRLEGLGPQPPYELAGRLLFFAGLALFVAAGVLMYRSPPGPAPVEEAPESATEKDASQHSLG